MASVRVAVRVRPLNKREKQLSSKVIIHVNGSTTSIYKAPHIRGDELKDFSFDFSYDSTDRGSPVFASQERIFLDLGSDILKATFAGFNACMFAYGQTGSGKSYTMMGHAEDKGLIPRICEGLFCEISHRSKSDAVSFRTEVSYLEIYNERVRDLLHKRTTPTDGGGLKVREHPRDGPYVENLSKHFIHNHSEMEDLIVRGNANRTTASTAMNDVSSRSHAILTINFTQAWFDEELPRETLSKIHLVDLAGSERADATCVTGIRLKEGANINKSLVTLGSVISALADLRVGASTKKKKHIFIPYRDSVLTWLLKDSLGGNSMTTMIATVSPADVNLSETLSTLRYASRAKNIVNSPTVNEDGSVKVIRELRAEVTRLQKLLEEANQVFHGELSLSEKVEEELHQNEAKVLALTKEWSSKWNETQNILQEETVALRKEGSGVILDCQLPHLIDIEDVLSTGIILYYLKEGRTLIGSDKTSRSQDIVLRGPGLLSEHCVLENRAGTVTLIPQDGALCSVNGSVVTNPCQLMQGAIIQLGNGSMLRFNHPTEAAQLREKRQGGLLSAFSLSLTDMPKSTENLSKAMLQNPRRMEEKLNQQEVAWQQVQGSLNRCNRDIKGLPKENSGTPHQWSAEEQRKRAEMEETGNGEMDIMGAEMVPSSCLTSAIPEKLMMRAITGKYPVPQTNFELDGDILQRGVSTRDGHDQERDSCHKSRPGLMSERPWRKAQSGVGVASYKGEEVWSGDASLQQTSVLGPGDGCGMKPEGNANEIQGVVADCYKGRPDSGGSSLRSMSHLQSSGGTSSTSVLPQTSTHSQLDKKPLNSQAPCRPPEETVCKGKFCCGEMDESGLKEIPVCVTETTAATAQSSGLSSLISRVSWMVQDAGHLLWSSRTVLQRVKKRGLQPLGAYWSSHVVSLVRDSNVVSAVKDSQVFSMVKGSFVFSLLKDSHIFSTVKELPLIQHIQMEITQHLQPTVTAQVIQDCINLDTAQLPGLTPTQTFSKTEDWPVDTPPIPEDSWTRNKSVGDLPQEKDLADLKQGDKLITELLSLKQISELEVAGISEDKDLTLETSKTVQGVQIFTQTLIEFPDSLSKLQTLPFLDMMDTLHAIISTSVNNSQKISVLCWLNVAKCSQPEPCPALLILADTGFYTLTTDTGPLVLFHHLPFLQLKEVHIGLAGHSLRLMGTTEESILGVYTHSQKLTRDLCWAIFSVICPGDSRVSQHPLIFEDLMKISLDWQAYVPDLLLDAGFRVCCQFQKRLADLVYLLHCNMDKKTVSLGEVKLLLYASVKVCISSGNRTEPLSQLVLTDTHLGLVQVDSVFYPTPSSITIGPCRPLFHDLTLRQRSDVRCVLVHDEDKCGAVRLDVILSNVRGRGHPESMSEAAALPAHASNSPLHAEVWKLTFSCSTEAACLINHLSNV